MSSHAKEWAVDRQKERAQLEKYRVFTRVKKEDIPDRINPVDTNWVYDVKRKTDESIEKYKAHKVGRGFTQIDEISYDSEQTYAQMMRPETLKMLIVIALHRQWDILQWDVIAAYLQAELHHDVYVSDVNEDGELQYWKLNKTLYGIKQAGHEWYKTLERILQIAALKQCIADEGTYTDGNATIGTHLDDLIGIAPPGQLEKIASSIEQSVELDNKGRPGKMLGMELTWNKKGTEVILTHTLLIENMMKSHFKKPVHGKGCSLPLDEKLFLEGDHKGVDQKHFQSIVGGLLFVAPMTRPEISIQVNLLGRRASKPNPLNMKAALTILEYLHSTKFEGIILKRHMNLELKIFADAKYGGEKARS